MFAENFIPINRPPIQGGGLHDRFRTSRTRPAAHVIRNRREFEKLKASDQWRRETRAAVTPVKTEARALRVLNFIALDFSDPAKSALETLAEDGRLAAYVDEYIRLCRRVHPLSRRNGGYRGEVRLSNDQ